MCETNVYIIVNGIEELYMENVNTMRPEGEKIYMKSLFGEQKTFEGSIQEISLVRHKIILKKD